MHVLLSGDIKMNDWLIVSYYTISTLYEQYAKRFVASMISYNTRYHVVGIPNLKDWSKNTNYKPIFLAEMLRAFPGVDVVWIDCDAELKAYPTLFDTIDCDIAAYEFNHREWYARAKLNKSDKFELLSGTVYLRNNEKVINIVDDWVKECENNPKVWDQKSLAKVLHENYTRLPAEYCVIKGTMTQKIKSPVVLHLQASRQVRKNPHLLK